MVLYLLLVGNVAFFGVRFLVYVDVVAHLVHVVGLDLELIHVFGLDLVICDLLRPCEDSPLKAEVVNGAVLGPATLKTHGGKRRVRC